MSQKILSLTALVIIFWVSISSGSEPYPHSNLAPYDGTSPTTPTNLAITATTDTAVHLNWSPSSDDNGVMGYKIFQDNLVVGVIGNLSDYTVNGLSPLTTYEFTVMAFDPTGNESRVSNSILATTNPSPNVGFELRINAGGPAVSYEGKNFVADQYYDGEGTYTSSHVTNPQPFKSIRLSATPSSGPHTMQYAIPLDNGSYQVTLHFLEIYWGVSGNGGIGNRVFDVVLEGQLIEDDLDLASKGQNVVYSPSHLVAITDGVLTIDFEASVNDPIISAIEIIEVVAPPAGSIWNTNGNDINYTDGNVGIGTTAPGSYKLAVNGNIHTKEVKVDLIGWADYVFKEDYSLPTLTEVENHIKEKGHLINIPSAAEVEANGIQLGEMNKLLLEKIEELTLYTLMQEEKIKSFEREKYKIQLLQEELIILKNQIEKINNN